MRYLARQANELDPKMTKPMIIEQAVEHIIF